jgi:hypothetical protein
MSSEFGEKCSKISQNAAHGVFYTIFEPKTKISQLNQLVAIITIQ